MSSDHTYKSQVDFSSDQIQEDRPLTEHREEPDNAVALEVFNRRLKFDDGATHLMWGFETRRSGRGFPSPLIRVNEGQIFHAKVHPSMGPHTVHWHGLEPDPRNDGVGHTSFEIDGTYTYQWHPEVGVPGDPNLGAAGTYFYHCHVNTPLHVQMGMFGPLIIDPVVHPDFPVRAGSRRPFVDGPEYDIDTETLLVPYSLDTRWHTFDHAAGLSGEDVGLNRFDPGHFYLLGGELARRPSGDRVWGLRSVRANVEDGTRAPTLLRLLNGNYVPTTLKFTDSTGAPAPMAELISHDGRPFRETGGHGASPPCHDTDYRLITSVISSGAAERYDMLLHPPAAGTYYLTVRWEHWIERGIIGERTVPIIAA